MGEQVDPIDLLRTIRKAVNEWAAIYAAEKKHAIEPVFLSSLANDVAFELGILEAIDASRLSPTGDA